MTDLNLIKGAPTIDRHIDLIKQQLDVLFNSTPGDLHGDTSFGTTYEYYLYDLKLSAEQIEGRALEDIRSLQLFGYTPTVHASLYMGSERDILLIEIQLSREDGDYKINYKIV